MIIDTFHFSGSFNLLPIRMIILADTKRCLFFLHLKTHSKNFTQKHQLKCNQQYNNIASILDKVQNVENLKSIHILSACLPVCLKTPVVRPSFQTKHTLVEDWHTPDFS